MSWAYLQPATCNLQSIMNRLRSRFILAFISVIFLVLFVPILLSIVASVFNLDRPDPEVVALMEQIPPEVAAEMTHIFRRSILVQVATFLLIGAGFGTVAAILLSRQLARPLTELADAAQDIGRQNLSRRVDVTGAEEIIEVANSFNEMAARLEQAEELRQNLLTDVAHELRTPVTVIQGNLRAILDDVYPLDKEEVARLYEQTLLLTHLIEDLRELAQAEAHQLSLAMVDVDVVALVKGTAVTYKPIAAEKNITLRTELLGALTTIQADEARLRQCLLNLLDNAIRYTPENGTIIVQAEQLAQRVELRVIDDGVGIAMEHLPHVFDRFYRADSARSRALGGSGLGLAIVRAVVEEHGGTVTAVSEGPGHGSTFTISLPLIR